MISRVAVDETGNRMTMAASPEAMQNAKFKDEISV